MTPANEQQDLAQDFSPAIAFAGLPPSRSALRRPGKRCAAFCTLATLLALFPTGLFAQTASQPANQGPMVVERLHSGFVVAPDFKVTEVDNRTSALAGGYAGWLSDESLFVGGGAYWLANQAGDRKMAYGGLVVQWLTRADRRIGFAAKGLIGGGRATLGTTVPQTFRLPDLPDVRDLSRFGVDLNRFLRIPTTTRVRYRESFLVAEPEVDVLIKLARQFRLTGGIGYRLIDAEGRDGRRLGGATGSIALQIGGGS